MGLNPTHIAYFAHRFRVAMRRLFDAIFVLAVFSDGMAAAQAIVPPKWEDGDFVPIQLKCPDTNKGTMQLDIKDLSGTQIVRATARFVNGRAIDIVVSATRKPSDKFLEVATDRHHDYDPYAAAAYAAAKLVTVALKGRVCDAPPDQRAHFFRLLKAGSPLLKLYDQNNFDYRTIQKLDR